MFCLLSFPTYNNKLRSFEDSYAYFLLFFAYLQFKIQKKCCIYPNLCKTQLDETTQPLLKTYKKQLTVPHFKYTVQKEKTKQNSAMSLNENIISVNEKTFFQSEMEEPYF